MPAEVGSRALRLLASVQALNHAGEACFAVSLAGSLFFGVSVDAARPLIILYLALTMAPFAVVVPLIGPVIDRIRGGQRAVILASLLGRAGIFVLLAIHLERPAFYPEAFAALVLAKTYLISKAAIVPRFEAEAVALVKANSRLAVAGAIGGTAGGAAATALLVFADATWVLRAGAGILVIATAVANYLPATGATAPVPSIEVPELRSPFIRAAALATGSLRLSVGFMTFHLAFALKRSGEPLWVFGLVLAAGAVGGFSGAISAPALRRRVGEDRIIAIGLAFPVIIAAVAALRFHVVSAVAVAACVGLAGAIARQGFDSLVQRQAPDVDRGRAFARFETQFQLAWVFGALNRRIGSTPRVGRHAGGRGGSRVCGGGLCVGNPDLGTRHGGRRPERADRRATGVRALLPPERCATPGDRGRYHGGGARSRSWMRGARACGSSGAETSPGGGH